MIVTLESIAQRVLASSPRCGDTRLVCIDGPSGSGKTVLADRLASAMGDPPVLHMDDIYPGWDGLADAVPNLRDWVVAPLAAGLRAHYHRYDWARGEYAERHDIGRPPVLIVEGVGSGARAVADHICMLVWVEAPRDERFRRGIERDGEAYRPHWERWARQEDGHFEAEGTRGRATVKVNGAPGTVHGGRGGGNHRQRERHVRTLVFRAARVGSVSSRCRCPSIINSRPSVHPGAGQVRCASCRRARDHPVARPPRPTRRMIVATSVALLCMTAVLLEATAGLLPDEPVFWVLTPLRLVLGTGIAAVLVAGLSPARFRTPLDPAIVLLLLAAAASTLVARQDWSGWRGVLTAVAAYYLVVGVRRALPGSWPSIALLALVCVAVAGTVAVRQFANGTATGFCRGALDASSDVCAPGALIRAVGTFANPNLLAAFLVLLLPVAAAGAWALADRSSRLLGTAVVVVGYAAVLLTGSRGGVFAALTGAAAFVVLRRPGRTRLVLACAASVAAAVALVVTSGGSAGVRADVWGAAFRIVGANLLGVGPRKAGALLDAAIPGDEAFQHAHNLWLNWAVETGLPGLLAVIAITVGAGLLAFGAARAGSAPAVAAAAGLAGFAVMSIADHPANALRVSTALWMVLALVVRTDQLLTGERTRSGSR